MRPIEKIVAAAGGQSALARHLGIRQQSVHEWVIRGFVPAARAQAVAKLSKLSLHDIRPDIYPSPRPRPARKSTTTPADA